MKYCSIFIDFYLDSQHDWVNWLAFDVDGQLWGYEFEPEFNEDTGVWHVGDPQHLSGLIGNIDPELVPEWFGDYFLEVGD